MRCLPIMMLVLVLLGCATNRKYDPRLSGTWHSDRDATVAAAFERDPRWTTAPAERIENFKDLFGHMTVTFTEGTARADYKGQQTSFDYEIVERGKDYVVIRTKGNATEDGRTIRIRFVDKGLGYWIDTGPVGEGLEEKFDKVVAKPGAAPNPVPPHP
jgi:hypothetical protein